METRTQVWYEDEIKEAQGTKNKGTGMSATGATFTVIGLLILLVFNIAFLWLLIAGPALLIFGIGFYIAGANKESNALQMIEQLSKE